MTINTDTLNTIQLRLTQGAYFGDICKEFGFSRSALQNLFKKGALIKPTCKRVPRNYIALDIEKLKQAYMRGDSVLKMSKDFGVERIVIQNRLKKLGYHIRSGSEANLIRFANSSKEYRMQITQKAHDSVRGVKRSIIEREKAAQSREKTANKSPQTYSHCGLGEIEIFNALVDKKLNPIIQKAFKVYNIDIFINPNIFIEISCDPYPTKSQCVRKRVCGDFIKKAKEITQNKGVLFEINFTEIEILKMFLNDIISRIQLISIKPSSAGKHFVVACYNKSKIPKGKFYKIGGKFAPHPKKPFWEVIKINTLSFG